MQPRSGSQALTAARHNLYRSSASARITPAAIRHFPTASTPLREYTGRKPDEHVVNRTDGKDVQSKPSQQGMNEKVQGKSESHGIAETGGGHNAKAEKERPKAPRPVIGMNDERGEQGY